MTEAWREAHKDEIEPASVLLGRIREERRKDKKYKELPPVNTEGLPELPEGWIWTTIETLHPTHRTCAYGVLQPGDDVEGGIPLVRVGDIGEGGFYNTNLKKIDPKISDKYKRTILQGGEVLVSLVGAIGRTAVAPEYLKGANTARAVGVIPLSEHINPHYLEMWIRQPTNNAELESKAHEVARKTLNLEDVRVFKVALAPKKEQDVIVSEIRQKFSIIDSIDKIVLQSILHSNSLRQSILKKAFEGPSRTPGSQRRTCLGPPRPDPTGKTNRRTKETRKEKTMVPNNLDVISSEQAIYPSLPQGNSMDESAISQIIKIIIDVIDPDSIILFGSRAKGNAHDDSDYDICIFEIGNTRAPKNR